MKYTLFLGVLAIFSPCFSHALQPNILWQLQTQRTWQYFDDTRSNNPANAVYNFYDTSDSVELSADFELAGDNFVFQLNPRANYIYEKLDNGRSEDDDEFSLRYGFFEYFRGQQWLKIGRYVNWWGPARLLSPTNPYHIDTGQISPHTEQLARDYFELGSSLGDAWQIAATWNFHEGEQEVEDFSPVGDLQVTWQSMSLSLSMIVSSLPEGYTLGSYGQWTLNDAWIFYTDLSFNFNVSNVKQMLIAEDEKDNFFSGIIGASYTFPNGLNIALDYFRNGAGFDEDESDFFFNLNERNVSNLLSGQSNESETQFLRSFGGLPFYQLGKNYAILMLQRNNFRDDFDIGYIYVNNLDDKSAQHTVNVDYRVSDSFVFFFSASLFSGSEKSEFGRFIDEQLQIGVDFSF